jgi:hypothetical protein
VRTLTDVRHNTTAKIGATLKKYKFKQNFKKTSLKLFLKTVDIGWKP